MEGTGATLGDNLDFGAGRTIEIRSLTRSINLELFDAVRWGGHYARRRGISKCLRRHATGWVADHQILLGSGIYAAAAVHIVGVVATIQRKIALIVHRAPNVAAGAYARLQFDEG